MSDAVQSEPRPAATLVATKALVALAPSSTPDPEPRWNAARLPIVERDSYEISGEIAHGGVGRILEGRSVHLDRPVAIKELLEPGDAAASRFVCEALLTARLQHPSIVPVYEAGRWPSGELFYAMKLVSGRSLADVLSEPHPSEPRLSLLPHVIAVAEAMAYAHSERIIHRDLKPANILVGSFGETVVIDWGLAKDLADIAVPAETSAVPSAPRPLEEGLTMAGAVMGTPAYMPPEQAKGEAVDERADVYALGAILYHVLSGAPPYEGPDVRALLKAVVTEPPPPLEQRARAVSLDLCTIVDKAMARDPADRYPSARELAEDLVRFRAGQIVGARKYTWGDLLLRSARRFRAPLAVAAAAALALSAAIGVGFSRTVAERDRAAQQQVAAETARREAIQRADDLTLVQARASAAREPDRALAWLASLSSSFVRWSAARTIAAEAASHGLSAVLRGHAEGLNGLAVSPDARTLVTTSDDHTARVWDLASGESRVLSGHADEVWSAEVSPDGRLVATASKDQTIRLWALGREPVTAAPVLIGHEGTVTGMVFLSEEALLSCATDGTVRLWNVETGEGRVLAHLEEGIRTFRRSPDGRRLVTGTLDGTLWIWDLDTREPATLEGRRLLGHLPGELMTIAFSPDGSRLAARSYTATTILYDVGVTPAPPPTVLLDLGHQGELSIANGVSFSPNGTLVAFGGEGSTLIVADLRTGRRRTLDGREGKVGVLSFSPDGRRIATGSVNGPVQVWDLETETALTLHGFDDQVSAIAFLPDGHALAAVSYDHTARIFPLGIGDGTILDPHGAPLTFTAFSPGGDVLATADTAGAVSLWDVGDGGPRPPDSLPSHVSTPGHDGRVCGGGWSPDGSLLATIGTDGAVRLWDRWGEPRGSLPTGERGHHCGVAAFSPDGRRLAWSAPGGAVGLHDLDSAEDWTLHGHEGSVFSLAFSPDGATLASGGSDGTVRVWPVGGEAPGEPHVLRRHRYEVLSLAFSPDGKVLASGGRDHTLRLWDVAAGDDGGHPHTPGTARIVDAGGAGVDHIVFSPDGETVYTGSNVEAGVRVWNAQTGRPRDPGLLRGHEGGVGCFALSPTGDRLAAAAAHRVVRLWDLASGESRTLAGHGGPVSSVAFSPDGRTVASAGADGTLRLFRDDLPSNPEALKAWIREAQARALPAALPATTRLGKGADGKGS